MVASKGQAIGLGVVSLLTIGAGIAVMVLFHFLFVAMGASGEQMPALSLFWPYGVPVLLTGVLGIVAAAVRNNVGLGIFMGICIICLIVEAALFVMMGLVLFVLLTVDPQAVARDCWLINDSCECQGFAQTGLYTTCEDPVVSLIHLSRAACALIIVSWFLMLAGSIISCAACCCGKRQDSHGVVIAQRPGAGYEMGYVQAPNQYPEKA